MSGRGNRAWGEGRGTRAWGWGLGRGQRNEGAGMGPGERAEELGPGDGAWGEGKRNWGLGTGQGCGVRTGGFRLQAEVRLRPGGASLQGVVLSRSEDRHLDVAAGDQRTGCGVVDVRRARVDDDDRALADHVECAVLDDHRGRLVDADADQRRMIQDGADQTVVALPLQEVLVDQRLWPEAEPLGGDRGAGRQLFEVGLAGEHLLADDGGAGARAADGDAGAVPLANDVIEPGAGDGGHEAVLVAARHPGERGAPPG